MTALLTIDPKEIMMNHFRIINNAITMVQNDNSEQSGELAELDIQEHLQKLSIPHRNAILGLIAGMGPIITVQTMCRVEATKLWDLKYQTPLWNDLVELRKRFPINVAIITSIAKDIYIRRNTMTASSVTNMLFDTILSSHISPEEFTPEMHSLLSVTFYNAFDVILRGRRDTISELPKDDYDGHKLISEAINVGVDENTANILNLNLKKWRYFFRMVFKHAQLLLNVNVSEVDDEALFTRIVDYFTYEILPIFNIENGTVDYDKIAILSMRYTWNPEYVDQSSIRIDPSNESFDPVSADTDNFFLLTNYQLTKYDEHYNNSLAELNQEMESFRLSVLELNKLLAVNHDISVNGLTFGSLEALRELIPNVRTDYAMEDMATTYRLIMSAISKHVYKIILVAMGIIIAVLTRWLFSGKGDKDDKNVKDKIKKLDKEIETLKKEEKKPTDATIDPVEIKAVHGKIELAYISLANQFNTGLDEKFFNSVTGYTARDIMATLKAHSKLITDIGANVKLMSEEIQTLKKPDMSNAHVLEYAMRIESLFFKEDFYMIKHDRTPMYRAIRNRGGFLPESNEAYKACCTDVKWTYPSDKFWEGTFNKKLSGRDHEVYFYSHRLQGHVTPSSLLSKCNKLESIDLGDIKREIDTCTTARNNAISIKVALDKLALPAIASVKGRTLSEDAEGSRVISISAEENEVIYPVSLRGQQKTEVNSRNNGAINYYELPHMIYTSDIMSLLTAAMQAVVMSVSDIGKVANRYHTLYESVLAKKTYEIDLRKSISR